MYETFWYNRYKTILISIGELELKFHVRYCMSSGRYVLEAETLNEMFPGILSDFNWKILPTIKNNQGKKAYMNYDEYFSLIDSHFRESGAYWKLAKYIKSEGYKKLYTKKDIEEMVEKISQIFKKGFAEFFHYVKKLYPAKNFISSMDKLVYVAPKTRNSERKDYWFTLH